MPYPNSCLLAIHSFIQNPSSRFPSFHQLLQDVPSFQVGLQQLLIDHPCTGLLFRNMRTIGRGLSEQREICQLFYQVLWSWREEDSECNGGVMQLET